MTASLVVHLAAIAGTVMFRAAPIGDGVTPLDAIVVSLVSVESLAAQTPMPDAAMPAPPATAETTPTMAKPVDQVEVRQLELPPAALDTGILRQPPIVEVPAPGAIASTSAEEVPAAEPRLTPTVPVLSSTAAMEPTVAVATQGEIDRFARGVVLALSRSRPPGVGQKGRVEVEFSLMPSSGFLDRVVVARSSGNRRLDDMARAAVEKASYPLPPAGATAQQLTYRIPFSFQ